MANNQDLKTAIQQIIKQNGNNEITGNLMQDALISIINQFGAGGIFAGIASKSTNPGTPDQNVYYLAYETGVYPNFNAYDNPGNLVVFQNISGAWVGTVVLEMFQYSTYWGDVGYVNKYYGYVDSSSTGVNYRSSFFLKISDRNNLIVTGVSGSSSNNVALVGFYDSELKFLGFYNSSTPGNSVSHLVPASSIPNNAEYVKVSRQNSQLGAVKGVRIDGSMINTPVSDLYNSWIFKDNGHINKNTGDRDVSSGSTYRCSKFLRVLDRNNLVVTGYSGATNSVALVSFYDENFLFIQSYNVEGVTGIVEDYKIPAGSLPANCEFIKVTKQASQLNKVFGVDFKYKISAKDSVSLADKVMIGTTIEQTNFGYISKYSGMPIIDSSTYRYSGMYIISDRSNIKIKAGYSGAGNNVALISFFNNKGAFIGYYNTPTTGLVTDITVPEADVPTEAYYCKFTIGNSQINLFNVSGVRKLVIKDTKEIDIISEQISKSNFKLGNDVFFNNLGYINKTNGLPWDSQIPTTGYRNSYFLKIDDIENIRVTGFSGKTNNAALAYFYDEQFNPLGFYNADVQGSVTNHLVPLSNIPNGSYYVRFTRSRTQPVYVSGVSFNYELPELLKYIDGKKTTLSENVKPERSGRPNPDFNGHVKLVNYLNNDQNIHPKVLYFSEPWNGFNYWMAYTPYPNGSVLHENPCIAASIDGKEWETPTGLTNPLEFAPRDEERPTAYNSDTHLVYNNDTNELECWWRSVDPGANPTQIAIKRRRSTDGINWGATEMIFDWYAHGQVSQAVIYEDGLYKYWACSGASTSTGGGVIYTESANPFAFPAFVDVPIDFDSENLHAWHMDVIRTPKGLEFVIQCWEIGVGNNNTSDLYYVLYDGNEYSKPKLIVERGDLPTDRDYMGIYRASIVWHPYNSTVPRQGGYYFIYYSALGRNYSFRAIYLTSGRSVDRLRGVNL